MICWLSAEWLSQQLLIVGSFGATSVLIYAAPESPFAQPSHVLFGSVLSACVGVGCYQLLGATLVEQGRFEDPDGTTVYTGDLLEPYFKHIQNRMFHGFDFDVTMLRIAATSSFAFFTSSMYALSFFAISAVGFRFAEFPSRAA